MWGAQFVSNIGSWMQTVGAQWLMLTLTSSATYVALVQTAASLPVVLFAVVAGAAGDLVDRRHFLLATQGLMLVAAVALGALALAGLVTPWLLLALIFALGTGQALTSPTWQTLQPELVPADRAPTGHLARGGEPEPGPGGGTGDRRHRPGGHQCRHRLPGQRCDLSRRHRRHRLVAQHAARTTHSPREHVGEAIRAGGRYVAASPVLRAILLRAALFIVLLQLACGRSCH